MAGFKREFFWIRDVMEGFLKSIKSVFMREGVGNCVLVFKEIVM